MRSVLADIWRVNTAAIMRVIWYMQVLCAFMMGVCAGLCSAMRRAFRNRDDDGPPLPPLGIGA